MFVQLLTHAYKTQVKHPTGTTVFSLVLPRNMFDPTTFDRPSALRIEANNVTAHAVLQSKLLHRIDVVRQREDQELTAAQRKNKDHHDRRVCAKTAFRPAG